MPILPTGVCEVADVSAQVPAIVKVDPLPAEAEPNSRTMSVTTEWLKPLPSPDDKDGGDDDEWGTAWETEPVF